MLARDRPPLPRSFLAGTPSPSRKLEGDKANPYPLGLIVQNARVSLTFCTMCKR